eukprot:6473778-Amphidinium_carterae.1
MVLQASTKKTLSTQTSDIHALMAPQPFYIWFLCFWAPKVYILGFHAEKGGGASACQRAQTRFQHFVQQWRSSYEPIRIHSLLFADDSQKLREAMQEFEKKANTNNTLFSRKAQAWSEFLASNIPCFIAYL